MNLRGIERRLAKLERKLNPRATVCIWEGSPRFSEAVAEAHAAGRQVVIVRWLKPAEVVAPQ